MWNYIKSALLLLFVGLVVLVKILLGKNRKLQDEIEVKDKQTDMRREQDHVVNEVRRDENEKIEKLVKHDRVDSRADRINRVLDPKGGP